MEQLQRKRNSTHGLTQMLSSSDNSFNQMSSNPTSVDNDTTLSSINICDFTLLGVEDSETIIAASHVHSTNDNELNVGDMMMIVL